MSYCKSRNVKKSELEEKLQDDIKNNRLEKAYKLALKQLQYQLEHLDYIYGVDNSSKINEYKAAVIDLTKAIKDALHEYSCGKMLKEIYEEITSEDNEKITYYKQEIIKLESPLQELKTRQDAINIRINDIQKKLLKSPTESDYLEFISFIVLDNKLITKYNVPEMERETTEALKLINEKHNLSFMPNRFE